MIIKGNSVLLTNDQYVKICTDMYLMGYKDAQKDLSKHEGN